MASADVQIASSGTSRPLAAAAPRRSRGVKIELLVSTRNGVPASVHCWSNSAAPGSGMVLVDEHAVHVGEPALDLVAAGGAPLLGPPPRGGGGFCRPAPGPTRPPRRRRRPPRGAPAPRRPRPGPAPGEDAAPPPPKGAAAPRRPVRARSSMPPSRFRPARPPPRGGRGPRPTPPRPPGDRAPRPGRRPAPRPLLDRPEQPVGEGVFEDFHLPPPGPPPAGAPVVHLVPVIAHVAHEPGLNQPVPAHDRGRAQHPGIREPGGPYGTWVSRPAVARFLDHFRDG